MGERSVRDVEVGGGAAGTTGAPTALGADEASGVGERTTELVGRAGARGADGAALIGLGIGLESCTRAAVRGATAVTLATPTGCGASGDGAA
jgi:hypothetical protein